jgi:hypothetical protein
VKKEKEKDPDHLSATTEEIKIVKKVSFGILFLGFLV